MKHNCSNPLLLDISRHDEDEARYVTLPCAQCESCRRELRRLRETFSEGKLVKKGFAAKRRPVTHLM